MRRESVIPWYKPCWSPDLYRAFFMWEVSLAVRSSLLQRMGENPVVTENESTGKEIVFYRSGRDPSADGSPVFGAGGFERDCHSIGHMETVLFHGTFLQESESRDRMQTSRDSRECTPGKSTRRQRNPQNCPVELAAKAAEEARELFARELRSL